eukprot:1031119-Rhodomonas_salina.2
MPSEPRALTTASDGLVPCHGDRKHKKRDTEPHGVHCVSEKVLIRVACAEHAYNGKHDSTTSTRYHSTDLEYHGGGRGPSIEPGGAY